MVRRKMTIPFLISSEEATCEGAVHLPAGEPLKGVMGRQKMLFIYLETQYS
jgi:hypothetical protein